ncbi:hypothetical protein JMA_27270 [Jeotgalibacillus malaysiensis]|uniref:Uncharacterized protein n=1 Tax=Jeotgalibacillus malaysiensis TaxID=1508404 RepID=A0A0B5AVL6_9BACL|nr:hypothetical protein [Jeotgalibacillus malaysiensis]AJD92044.1 hypothetical protein JMA_27270 [Jeotgalibacillus malaysiensis]
MNITIGEYQITTDPLNYKLEQKVQKKDEDGQPLQDQYITRRIGYYPSFERVCTALLDHQLIVSDAENIAEIHEVVLKTKREIIAAVKERGFVHDQTQTIEETRLLADGIEVEKSYSET